MRKRVAGYLCLAMAIAGAGGAQAGEFVALPTAPGTIEVMAGDETYLEFRLAGWGPNWKWLAFGGQVTDTGTSTRMEARAKVDGSGAELRWQAEVRQAGPKQLEINAQLAADRPTDLTCVVIAVAIPERHFSGGRVEVESQGGKRRSVRLPLGRKGLGRDVRRFTLFDAVGRRTPVGLEPAAEVASDEEARIMLAGRHLAAAAPRRLRLVVELPGTLTYYRTIARVPEESGTADWYAFQPAGDYDQPSEIGMADWLDAPAGKYGRIHRDGDQLVYGGRPVKLWGINVCFSSCAPDKKLAERRAAFYAKYGINSVRLHKYADGPGWAGIQSADSFVRFDPEGLDRMDYFVAQLKRRGIYVTLSAHFGAQKLGPADKQYVPYLEEFGRFTGRDRRITTPHSAVHYSPELQDVQIRQMVNLLKHRNPYTGLTYAEDPAVAFVEIINEQSILFYTSMAPLKASPTLRRYVAKRFCDWLRAKYGSHERLVQAWGGARAFDSFQQDGFPAVGEHLDRDNILPLGNPWYWDPEQLNGSQAFRRQRLLDTLVFLYQLQNEFYDRYVEAVRRAGYQGEVLASNWQAGRAVSHYYNLHSDYRIGTIDRHNYFGGGSGMKIDNRTMLRVPGSGMLSAGMQQVADRPFMLSEWIHVYPNPWGVEGPAIIGAYGMGLQGWDVSYMFQNRDTGGFQRRLGESPWEVAVPQILGVFPAVARQVLRGDVRQSRLQAVRYVHVPSLAEGKLDFEDRITQQHDVKTFASDKVPAESLAVARCVVSFVDAPRPTPNFDPAAFLRDGVYVSSTGQLRWRPGTSKLDGVFTIDTAGTQAVVGFAQAARFELSQVTIEPQCPFAAIYVTAQQPQSTIASAEKLLVVAMARARNTGMKVFRGTRLLHPGQPPVRLEPVRATISLRRPGQPTVWLLDHDGRRTGRTLPVRNGTFHIDGARDRTPYYLVEY